LLNYFIYIYCFRYRAYFNKKFIPTSTLIMFIEVYCFDYNIKIKFQDSFDKNEWMIEGNLKDCFLLLFQSPESAKLKQLCSRMYQKLVAAKFEPGTYRLVGTCLSTYQLIVLALKNKETIDYTIQKFFYYVFSFIFNFLTIRRWKM